MVSIRCDADANADANADTDAYAKATADGRSVKPSVWRRSSRTTKAIASLALVLYLGCGATTIKLAESFQTTTTPTQPANTPTTHMPLHTQGFRGQSPRSHDPLYLFGRNKGGDDNGNANDDTSRSSSNNDENETGDSEKKRLKIPFFGRMKRSKEGEKETPQEPPKPVAAAAPAYTPRPRIKMKELPSADELKLMAERARLEAERLDAELTLSKIEKLEKQLVNSKKRGESDTGDVVEDLQTQLDALQAKLRGEVVPIQARAPKVTTTAAASSSESSSTQAPTVSSLLDNIRTGGLAAVDDARVLEVGAIIAKSEPEVFTNIRSPEDLDIAPEFLVKLLAPFYGLKPGSDGKIDKKELLSRWNRAKDLDYSFYADRKAPFFDNSDIRKKKVEIVECDMTKMRNGVANGAPLGLTMDVSSVTVTNKMMEKANGNATQLALYSLEYDYYLLAGGEQFMSTGFMEEIFQNATYFGSMYPKCVNNRGENNDDYVSEEPTEAQVDVLSKTILPAIKFSSSSKPQKVPGGYAITGSHKFENGDLLIEAIDNEIAKSRPNLKEQMTVLYTPSYGPLNQAELGNKSPGSMDMSNLMDDDVLEMFADSEPILYITGPNIVRNSNSIGLALTSAIGLATSWYLSVYPFLLNDQIAGKIDADLQLVQADLQPDLSYLTDLSIPLFFCFMGLQLIHEFAHRLTAMSRNVELSTPVFVPSFITGITTTVTTFKTLPKNKNDMFDISAAGPLAGVVCSSIALVIGAKLTLITDPSILPALPLDILRQSTLGGAIIDNIIPGSLFVPDGAPTAGITIPLHPIGIAGYVGLIVNALALLPIGTTDGGRLTMALFDRAEKMSIGTLTLTALLFAGLFGSDLFLFYFSFCLAFQTGNEVPARNEQDSVEFSRVIVALVCYTLAILTLVPVQ